MKWSASKRISLRAVRLHLGMNILHILQSSRMTIDFESFFIDRYGPRKAGSIIDNCQLSDWPVIDMDRDRQLVQDSEFDIFERASYGHGCEIQPILDQKHNKRAFFFT